MEMTFAENLKSLRKKKNVSQEKLAQYLNISFQAVSKWENGGACPDISLLPQIARFFGITVDELLQAEKIDEEKLFQEYEDKANDMFRNGVNGSEMISLWKEACHRMPNNVHAKECLMSSYFDADKEKYQKEIIELGTELYNSDINHYYKGQAIEQIARTYAENGNLEMAERWALKSYQLNHSQEMIYMQILNDGKELIEQFRFANYWYLNQLFYMAARLSNCEDIPGGTAFTQAVDKAVAQIYEIAYPGDDMSFESMKLMCLQHRSIAEDETALGKEEAVIKQHLTRAFEYAVKSLSVKAHCLTHPLLMGWEIQDAPSDNKQVVRLLKEGLSRECFAPYRNADWFVALEKDISQLL